MSLYVLLYVYHTPSYRQVELITFLLMPFLLNIKNKHAWTLINMYKSVSFIIQWRNKIKNFLLSLKQYKVRNLSLYTFLLMSFYYKNNNDEVPKFRTNGSLALKEFLKWKWKLFLAMYVSFIKTDVSVY